MTVNTGVTTVQKYKEKGVVEARQFLTEQDGREIAAWVGGSLYIDPQNGNPSNVKLTVTFGYGEYGHAVADVGDYIVKVYDGFVETQHRFYVLSKEEFARRFEKAGK